MIQGVLQHPARVDGRDKKPPPMVHKALDGRGLQIRCAGGTADAWERSQLWSLPQGRHRTGR